MPPHEAVGRRPSHAPALVCVIPRPRRKATSQAMPAAFLAIGCLGSLRRVPADGV